MASLQPAMIEKLADPISKAPIVLNEAGAKSERMKFPFVDGVLNLMPSRADIVHQFGMRNVVAWRSLQKRAEKSYATRTEGHFSVDSLESAVRYGDIVAEHKGEWLDVGCGKLETPTYMKAAANISFFGIDPLPTPIARSFPFVQAIGDFLPFKDESFDGVMFSSSLDHCINPLQALEQAWAVLKPGGKLLIWETVRSLKKYRVWRDRAVYFQTKFNATHNWAFTAEALQQAAEAAAFTSIEIIPVTDSKTAVLKAIKPFADINRAGGSNANEH